MGAAPWWSDAGLTLVGLLVPVALAVISTWGLGRGPSVRPEGEGDHVSSPRPNAAQFDGQVGLHRARVGVRVVHYATALDLYREVWELGPAPRGWHLVRTSKVPLAYGRVPDALLLSGDIARQVLDYDRAAWPFLTDSRPDETIL